MHTPVPVPLVRWSEVAPGAYVARAFGLTVHVVEQAAGAWLWRLVLPTGPTLAGRAGSREAAERAVLRVARAAAVEAIREDAALEAVKS